MSEQKEPQEPKARSNPPRRPYAPRSPIAFGGRNYMTYPALVRYLVQRMRYMPAAETQGEVEGVLRRWVRMDDADADGLPLDIPALAEAVRAEQAAAASC